MRLSFVDKHDFMQEAFDMVALNVSIYGQGLLVKAIPTPATEQCLEQLMRVCESWGYNYNKISALHSLFQEENDTLHDIQVNNRD